MFYTKWAQDISFFSLRKQSEIALVDEFFIANKLAKHQEWGTAIVSSVNRKKMVLYIKTYKYNPRMTVFVLMAKKNYTLSHYCLGLLVVPVISFS